MLRDVKIGKNYVLDEHVFLAYKSRRSKKKTLVIGENAIIRAGTILYAGSVIGSRLETGHNVVIREDNIIGDNFSIWSNSTIDYGCRIGNNVKVHNNCYVAQFTELQDNVFLAPGVIVTNDKYPGDPRSKELMQGPIIEKGAQIGGNSTILPYVRIGRNAMVGAGSIVTKDVPERAVVYGNPARIRGSIDEVIDYKGLNMLANKRKTISDG